MNTNEAKTKLIKIYFEEKYVEVILKCLAEHDYTFDGAMFLRNLFLDRDDFESFITQSISIINDSPFNKVGEKIDDLIYDYECHDDDYYLPIFKHSVIKEVMKLEDFNINPSFLKSMNEFINEHIRSSIESSDYNRIRNTRLKLKLTNSHGTDNFSFLYATRSIEEIVRISYDKKITLSENDKYQFVPRKQEVDDTKAKLVPQRVKISLPCKNTIFNVMQH